MRAPTVKSSWALIGLLMLVAAFMLFLLLVVLSSRGLGGRDAAAGSIQIQSATLRSIADQWFLDGTADINLPPSVRTGLDSGVPLHFNVTLSLFRPREFWPDRQLLHFERRYSLIYYELTRHYRVESLDTGASQTYRSLLSALDGLGTFRSVPLGAARSARGLAGWFGIGKRELADSALVEIAAAASSNTDQLHASMVLELDTRALPLPLQPLIASSWRLASEEHVWAVN